MPPPRQPFRPWVTLFSAAVLISMFVYMLQREPPHVPHSHFRGTTFGPIPFKVMTANSNLAAPDRLTLSMEIKAQLDAINEEMSTYLPDSEISRFNTTNSTGWMAISPAFSTVLSNALRLVDSTGGAFDPTVDSAVNRSGYGANSSATNAVIGAQFIELEALRLRKTRADVRLDLSAIAKGYAVDRLSDMLLQQGISNHLVEVGGEVRTRGVSTNAAPWPVFIAVPRPGSAEMYARIDRPDVAVATSGIAYQSRKEEERIIHHLIDPATGQPTENDLMSVSVMAPTCVEADGLATALFVMGREKGLAWASSQDGIEAMFLWVDAEKVLRESKTPGFN